MLGYNTFVILAALLTVAQSDLSSHLQDEYSFSMVLNHNPSYTLHWSVDVDREEVRFAVDADSQGWVGLGLSRTGQMIRSDVVTAWIDNDGKAQLQVRTNNTFLVYPTHVPHRLKIALGGYITLHNV